MVVMVMMIMVVVMMMVMVMVIVRVVMMVMIVNTFVAVHSTSVFDPTASDRQIPFHGPLQRTTT